MIRSHHINLDEADQIVKLLAGSNLQKNKAIELLFEIFALKIYKKFRFYGCDQSMAKDLSQDVWVRIKLTNSLPNEPAALTSWLWAIVKNIFLDHCRKSDSIHQKDTDSFDPLIHDNVINDSTYKDDVNDCLLSAIKILGENSPQKCIALDMCLNDYTIEDISLALKRTEQATRQFLYEARKSLKIFAQPCWELLVSHAN
jgi:RNA polymerase sigma factor (sigma-70 family)